MILKQCKGVHCVDLGESFPTHLLAKFGFATAENEPCEVCRWRGAVLLAAGIGKQRGRAARFLRVLLRRARVATAKLLHFGGIAILHSDVTSRKFDDFAKKNFEIAFIFA